MDEVKVFKGEHFDTLSLNHPKLIVFDLDETLGSFGDLYILWSGIKHLYSPFSQFDKLMDLYPEYLRSGILTILEFLYHEKKKKNLQIIIYTNNQCSKEWVQWIAHYFEWKVQSRQPKADIKVPLFHKLVCAFKIQKKQIESSRTTHRKTYSDLLQCTNSTSHTEICFVDDTLHSDMIHRNVYYICPKPYYHTLSLHEIIHRFIETKWYIQSLHKSPLIYSFSFWYQWFKTHKRYSIRPNTDNTKGFLKTAKQLYSHIRLFLNFGSRPKTRKVHRKNQKRTRKIRWNSNKEPHVPLDIFSDM